MNDLRYSVGRIAWLVITATLITAPRLSAADLDLDGLEDAIENVLAQRFAPVLYLHSQEAYYPATPAWYMARVHMRYNHNNCSDHHILDLGQVTNATIGAQSHRDTSTAQLCSHTGGENPSSGGDHTSRFFLQIPNDANEGVTRAGIRDRQDWVCYANARPSAAFFRHIDVQYWFFYARNGNLGGVGGEHEGDWEHITVRVAPDQTTIQAIYFAAHSGEGIWYFPGEYELENGRPVVYSAIDSHASYPAAGEYGRGFLPNDFTDAGIRHDFAGAVSRLGTPAHPANGHQWLNYNGIWGEAGSIFSGPSGPGYKGNYTLEAVENNPPPADHHFAEQNGAGCGPIDFLGLGTVECPWASLEIGLEANPNGHMLRLKEGVYVAAGLVIDQPIILTSYGGNMVRLE